MKKILFLINSLNDGGAERVLVDLANELSKNFDVTVQTVIDSGPFKERLSKDVRYKSIVKTRIPFLRRLFTYAVSFIISPTVVHGMHIGNQYDYEVAFLEGVPTKIIAASQNAKSKKYAWVHIDLVNTFGLEKVYGSMDEHILSYKKFDKIICVSNSVKDTFAQRFGITENVIVKYNVIDDEIVREKAKEPIEKSDRLRIVSVGRLSKRKGFDRLLWTMKMLVNEGIECELFLVGEGNRREELEGYIKYNGLADRVTLIGFTQNPYKYMASADFLVFPSLAEGYSTVATEAVILGKPAIATNCSGMKEIFGESEYGVVVDNNDKELYTAVKRMILDEEYRENYRVKAQKHGLTITKASRLDEIQQLFME